MIGILIGLTFFTAIAYWFVSKPRNLPPGPPILPIVGSLPFIPKQFHIYMMEMQRKYGDTFCFGFGQKLTVVISNYDTMKKVLGDGQTSGRDQTTIGSETAKQSGILHGVILSENELWKEHRRFALSTLRDFGMGKSWLEDAILEEVDDLCQHITKQKSQPFDPKKMFSCSVANVICALIFGKRFPQEDEKFVRFSTLTNENIQDLEKISIADGILWLKYIPGPLKRTLGDKVTNDQLTLMKYLNELVDEHEKHAGTTEASKSYVDSYNREARRQNAETTTFSRFQLLCTLSDLFAAGSETSSTTLLWSLLMMIENPEVTRKVKKEIASHIARDQPVRSSDRALLPFTEATLMEIQRVASLVPSNVPHKVLSDMTIDGFNVPKNSLILTNNYFIHRDPRYWKNPDEFNPLRFLDENGKIFKPDGFVPFSVGKRACLGESLAKMELWLFFANLMHRFDFRLPVGSTATTKDCDFAIVLSPKPFEIIFEPSRSSI